MARWFVFLITGLAVLTAEGEQGLRQEKLAAMAGKIWKEWAHVWDGSVKDDEVSAHLAEECLISIDQVDGEARLLKGQFQYT
ncbi:MAG: hypothetical protein ACPGAP_12555, partial [Akkermansiaceae bacterium]